MEDLRWASAVTQAGLLNVGSISASELHGMVVEAIEAIDPLIHAVVAPLFDRPSIGVPMLLKDAGQEIAGTPHWVGVASLRDAGATSAVTTALAARFEANGLSIIGKGACPQLSRGITTEPPGFEPTRNPWDRSRSAGGSSGGSAAAVASGMVSVAHGSDATGSLRVPAALCGVATLIPTAGRIPSVPPAGQPARDVWRDFVVSRHSEDLAWVFEMLTGSSVGQPTPGLRVGLLDHDPELGLPVHTACQAGVHLTGKLLEALGHHVDISWPPALDKLWSAAFMPVMVVSDSNLPAMLNWVCNRLGRPVRPGELADSAFDAAERAGRRTQEEVAIAEANISSAMAPILSWWDRYDVLVTPTTFQPAWPLGTAPGPPEIGTLSAPFSFTGQPSLSLPLHESDKGLPIGVEIVGRRGSDEMLLALAQDLQAIADWTDRRPSLG